ARIKEMEARRAEMMATAPVGRVGDDDAFRAQMRQQMEQRHAEMMQRVEAQRKVAEEQQAATRKQVEVTRAKSDI
ncbi:MAG: hypothetical protein KDI68_03175, partial [Gammaproteobacteria bacterium]|nr:hypothetical protein [Gammaproteobacteria bacterium]